jgi:hypothetical protein
MSPEWTSMDWVLGLDSNTLLTDAPVQASNRCSARRVLVSVLTNWLLGLDSNQQPSG